MDIYSWILTLAIISGQLIKVPLSGNAGITILDLVVAILCILGIFKLRFRLKKPPLFIKGAIVFIAVAILSLFATPLHLQLWEYLTSFLYTIRFSAYIFLGWIIFSGAFPKLQRSIPRILILSGLNLAVLGLLQFIFLPDLGPLAKDGWDPHYFRTVSTFLDPNFAGAFFALTLVLIFQKLAIAKKWKIFFFLIIYSALLTTFSRGAYLAFLTSFMTFSFLRKSLKLGIISLVLFLGLLLGFSLYQKSVALPRGIDRTQSAEFRLSTWQQGGSLFQLHPVLGVGFNAYRYAIAQYNLGDSEFLTSRGASTNDSSLLFVLATTGILGFAGILFFIFSTVWTNKYNFLLIAGILGLTVQSFFANTLFYPFILIWIILALVKLTKDD
ncbi:hypothetical protein A3D83_02165 [Candidatus Daviesbacteria bacterium RIFCSPHIGHO2_02_FULL_41_10]|uniref:O-antigen ligase-related domain-containing protein n=2 Tax=Candidatus Daviesiibacteriota TaxID=1752718 RepID=A0A1F5ITE7_9BACT|nr:MAG: hypothetical protein A2871_03325 [Candidatus Daviesbacteria bacterium RIFCSPHIGHO2_01_FULL_41_23]OGE32434.1 MAG: hypothetical protein A3D83_02165 [Candidatus Daviesbacteria bacterium RIFCSPHIGHO2_02_FULL_41_10]OGE61954.1 MAG: hypothetical protein A2967_03140 [Candidatus Daviesbacteria bacterium RIFCSPLOWO2_01_FULL_41_32]